MENSGNLGRTTSAASSTCYANSTFAWRFLYSACCILYVPRLDQKRANKSPHPPDPTQICKSPCSNISGKPGADPLCNLRHALIRRRQWVSMPACLPSFPGRVSDKSRHGTLIGKRENASPSFWDLRRRLGLTDGEQMTRAPPWQVTPMKKQQGVGLRQGDFFTNIRCIAWRVRWRWSSLLYALEVTALVDEWWLLEKLKTLQLGNNLDTSIFCFRVM